MSLKTLFSADCFWDWNQCISKFELNNSDNQFCTKRLKCCIEITFKFKENSVNVMSDDLHQSDVTIDASPNEIQDSIGVASSYTESYSISPYTVEVDTSPFEGFENDTTASFREEDWTTTTTTLPTYIDEYSITSTTSSLKINTEQSLLDSNEMDTSYKTFSHTTQTVDTTESNKEMELSNLNVSLSTTKSIIMDDSTVISMQNNITTNSLISDTTLPTNVFWSTLADFETSMYTEKTENSVNENPTPNTTIPASANPYTKITKVSDTTTPTSYKNSSTITMTESSSISSSSTTTTPTTTTTTASEPKYENVHIIEVG